MDEEYGHINIHLNELMAEKGLSKNKLSYTFPYPEAEPMQPEQA